MMGMPITIEIVGAPEGSADPAFDFFAWVDATFSPYRADSEVSQINDGRLTEATASEPMRRILALAEQTREETGGYFDVHHLGRLDPSGLVKGWAILNAANLLRASGHANVCVEAGGDLQVYGRGPEGGPWQIGIRHPAQPREIVRVLALTDCGIATSGTAFRGAHVYNPLGGDTPGDEIISLTVVGPDVYEADRFATAAFAMGPRGAAFVASLPGFEAYQIDRAGVVTYTPGLERAFVSC